MTNLKVNAFFRDAPQWREELQKLRTILLSFDLTEEIKWSKPCYAFQGHNLAILQPFKAYCALLFFKGALLKDPKGMLVKTGVNAEVGRQLRFTSVGEIAEKELGVKALIRDAIDVDKAGLKVQPRKVSELKMPQELLAKFNQAPAFKSAFSALTPGRQKAYIFYFSGAKQSQTRESRIEKCAPQILKGKGLNEP